MKIEISKYKLRFKFEAGTSRGVLTEKDSWFIKLFDPAKQKTFGIGECGLLPGLSPDLSHDFEAAINQLQYEIAGINILTLEQVPQLIPSQFPALRFSLETALFDLLNGSHRIIKDNSFTNSNSGVPINGLVWMGEKELMIKRIKEKIGAGYKCIKIKIGAIALEDELAILRYIRSQFSNEEITIRLDANGAFNPENALSILQQLSTYEIHSIEQPIKEGNWKVMGRLCRESPIPIALDEELIGITECEDKREMLNEINPPYIILKPSLVGGLSASAEWIKMAEARNIGWWVTSALESNIGLNAIAQFTADYETKIPQGLGTGQLYMNNIPSPLTIERGFLYYNNELPWDVSLLE